MVKSVRRKQVIFLVKFLAIFAVLHLLLYLFDLSPLQESIASLEAGWLGLEASGDLVFVGGQAFAITPSCTGLVASFILAAVVFALKKPGGKEKVATYLIGTLALLLINLLRVYLVLLAAIAYGVAAAEALHVASWFVMSALIIGLWYYSTTRIFRVKSFEGFL